MKTPVAALAVLSILSAALTGCGPSGGSGASGQAGDKFAGLDGEILKWRQEIIASDPLCKRTADDEKCQSFEVACKAERTVTPADQAKGVSARVVTMITWNGFDPKFNHPQSGVRTAEFTKTAAGWSRAPHGPVYMQSCGDM